MSLETIELTADSLGPTITLNKDPIASSPPPAVSSTKSSVNFGPGIELLMNDKKRASDNSSPSSPSADINLDLDSLAKELDGITPEKPKSSLKEAKSSLFSGNISKVDERASTSPVSTSPIESSNIKLNIGPTMVSNNNIKK